MSGSTQTEKQWQAQVLELAGYTGWRTYHTHDSRRSNPGWPDLVLVRPPELLVAELKTDKGRVRPEQAAWLEALALCGVECYVWRPSDWDVIAERLRLAPGASSRTVRTPDPDTSDSRTAWPA